MIPFTLRPYVRTALFLAIIVYAGIQYMTGSNGFFSHEARETALSEKQVELAKLQAERVDLEARAKYLQTDNLSPDLLEERARVLLGLSTPDAYIIRQPTRQNVNS